MLNTKPDLTESELIGFVIANPIRGALAEALQGAGGALSVPSLLKEAATFLSSGKEFASDEEIKMQLGTLHTTGIVEPYATGDVQMYRLTSLGATVVHSLFSIGSKRP